MNEAATIRPCKTCRLPSCIISVDSVEGVSSFRGSCQMCGRGTKKHYSSRDEAVLAFNKELGR